MLICFLGVQRLQVPDNLGTIKCVHDHANCNLEHADMIFTSHVWNFVLRANVSVSPMIAIVPEQFLDVCPNTHVHRRETIVFVKEELCVIIPGKFVKPSYLLFISEWSEIRVCLVKSRMFPSLSILLIERQTGKVGLMCEPPVVISHRAETMHLCCHFQLRILLFLCRLSRELFRSLGYFLFTRRAFPLASRFCFGLTVGKKFRARDTQLKILTHLLSRRLRRDG